MKGICWLSTIVSVLFCQVILAQQDYKPAYKDQWQTVKQQILATWHLSKAEPSTRRGALNIPLPYYSIRPNRNVLFGWDPYFTNAGLLLTDSLAIYARNASENQLAEIDQVGFVPNASEIWAMNRSQTPFLSMMVREVYEISKDRSWLGRAYQGLLKEYRFWTDTSRNAIEDHNTTIPGLQRFYQHANKEELLSFFTQIAPRFGFADDMPEPEKLALGEAWISEAETGMDFTPRFENRCHQFIALDLNANLYVYERNFAWMELELGISDGHHWEEKAENRKRLMNQYCWDADHGLFMDYDFVNKRFSKVPSIACFYPLWAGLATPEQAAATVKNLNRFEFAYGPTICEDFKKEHGYQWDFPAGWPPIYYLVAFGLDRYGYPADAKRIAAKYLDVVTRNYIKPLPATYTVTRRGQSTNEKREPGFVYEKYNVTDGSVYDAEYPSRTFHGWSYGVFIWCLNFYETH